MQENIPERITTIIIDLLRVEKEEVITTAKLAEDLGADSLDAVEIITACEKEFHINLYKISNTAAKLLTVGELINIVNENCNGKV